MVLTSGSDDVECYVWLTFFTSFRFFRLLHRTEISDKMLPVNDFQKIGVGLAGFGLVFLFLGMMLFFDRGLLAIGNILFMTGLTFVIGFERTFRFFFQKHKLRATGAFIGGIVIVLLGWPVIGMVIELYGFFCLFSGFIPVAVNFLRRVPVIGTVLNLPGISMLMNKIGEPQGLV